MAEADGSLYPCDFYVLDEWRLGSVADDLKALLTGETMRRFRQRSLRKPRKCASCRYFRLCRGGCPRDWEGMPENLENGLCAAFQMFFDYAAERILYIASLEQKSRPR